MTCLMTCLIRYAIQRLKERLASGALERVSAVPSSAKTERKLREKGVPCVSSETQPAIAVAIGSADAVDAEGNVIKGGKGALLREKLLRDQATRYIVAVDEAKLCSKLGASYPIPVEVAPFYAQRTVRSIMALPSLHPCDAQLRFGDSPTGMPGVGSITPFVTDNGNLIVDIFRTTPLKDVAAAAAELKATVGVVEHGLFVRGANSVLLVSTPAGVSTVAPNAPPEPSGAAQLAAQLMHQLMGGLQPKWLLAGTAAAVLVLAVRRHL